VVQDRQYDRLALTGCELRAIEDRQARDIPSLLAIDLALNATGANLNVGVRTDLVGLDFAATVGEAYLRILRAGPESPGAQRLRRAARRGLSGSARRLPRHPAEGKFQ